MRKKKLAAILLIVTVTLSFSVSILETSLGSLATHPITNTLALNSYASQTHSNDFRVKQDPLKLSVNLDAYYVQESGDYLVFIVIASTPKGLVPGIAIGNGSTGWHTQFTELFNYMPRVTMDNLEENVTLFIYCALVKSVWPSGLRIVDECFGLVGLFNPLRVNTSLPWRVTANGNMHMLLILSASGEQA
ncbi:MAG: hypothetical protein QXO71_01120 [Candidatus Jordarchaeaceae archaeon]